MKHTDTLWTTVTGGASITLAYLLGGLDNLVAAFAIFMVCDYITGIMAGAKNKQVSSRRALKGLGKKRWHDHVRHCCESVGHHHRQSKRIFA